MVGRSMGGANGSTRLLVPMALCAGAALAADPPAPAGLRCLTRHYAVRAELRDGGWAAVLPDGGAIAWDDGKAKGFDEKLEHPDVEDVFSIPYRGGAIRPVTAVDDDPGRVRLDELFKATYGATPETVDVVDVTFMGQKLKVHRKVAPKFAAVETQLKAAVAKDPKLAGFLLGIGGTFNWRNIAGTDRPSAHSWGVSMDINVKRSHYWRWSKDAAITWKNEIPQPIVDAFEAQGFIWGGRWYHYDTMHFEYRPELLDPACF
jgi:D-alanyl-D-alanine carboxypeptidase